MLNPTINKTSSGKYDLDAYAMMKYKSLSPEDQMCVKLRANEVIRLLHERSDEMGAHRQPFGFNSALSLLLVMDTLQNQEDSQYHSIFAQY